MTGDPLVTGARLRRGLWRLVLRATGGLVVEGALPEGPCVVVANHRSHADTAALVAAVPAAHRPLVAAAADYWFAGPLRSWVCGRLVGGFAVRRDGRGFDDLAAAARELARGRTVVVFPEGTRSRDGRIARFRSGAGRLAELADVPLVPVGLTGTGDLLPVHGRLRRTRVTVRIGAPTRDPDAARRAVCALSGNSPAPDEGDGHAPGGPGGGDGRAERRPAPAAPAGTTAAPGTPAAAGRRRRERRATESGSARGTARGRTDGRRHGKGTDHAQLAQ